MPLGKRAFPEINTIQDALIDHLQTHVFTTLPVTPEGPPGFPGAVPKQVFVYYIGGRPAGDSHQLDFVIVGLIVATGENQQPLSTQSSIVTPVSARRELNDWESDIINSLNQEQSLFWKSANFYQQTRRPAPLDRLPMGQMLEVYVRLII